MINIIKIQKDKSIGSIMFIINNETSYKNFLKKESIFRNVFFTLTCLLMIYNLAFTYYFMFTSYKIKANATKALLFLSFTEVALPYLILVVSLILLLCYMNKYHYYEMKKI